MNPNRNVLVALVVATLGVTLLVAAAIASPAHRHVRVVIGDAVVTTPTTSSTTTEATSTTTSTTTTAVDAPASTGSPSSTVEATTTTTTDPCAPPPGALDSPSDLISTITFDRATVEVGGTVGYTLTVENPHDEPVVFVAEYGSLIFPIYEFGGAGIGEQTSSACFGQDVFAPHSTWSTTGTLTADADSYKPGDVITGQLWVQWLMTEVTEYGGPGGRITVVAPDATTSTTSPNSPTTLAAS